MVPLRRVEKRLDWMHELHTDIYTACILKKVDVDQGTDVNSDDIVLVTVAVRGAYI